ncbi:MAG: DUF4294 domain-containing protein [Bacteroidales bacterium]|nr:DUF4294 domain-containing protein [Bacteroidales bacterium]
MKATRLIMLAVLAALSASPLQAQTQRQKGSLMEYVIIGTDTVYVDVLPPARVHPREYMNRAQWIQYYQRVHNFSKAYPYALFVAKTIRETDSIFVVRGYTKREQDRYLDTMKEELLKSFDPIFRQLTLKQGMMMIRLIDREVGMTPYEIIQKYLGNVNAGFWQGVAKVLKGDIKRQYEPQGEDKDLEELVKYWHDGEFDDLYDFIFGKAKPTIYIPKKFQQPFYLTVDTKQNKKDARRAAKEERKKKK